MKNRFVIITKKVICVIVSVTISHFTQAQYKITGYLNDLRSTPVEAASIILLNDSSGKVIKTSVSDAKGYFLLDRLKKQNYKLRITSINTRDTLLLVSCAKNDTVKLAIVLVDKNRLMTNVVVNSSRPMIQVKLGKIVFSPESMIGATGDNTLGLLQKTPLVSVTDAGEISVKGGSVGIMLNGRPLRIGTNELREMLRSIPASEVDYIEVITTPSSKYDAEGTSALLNIVLKKSKLFGVNGSITPTIEQTSYTRVYLPLSINYRDKKINFWKCNGK